jgi:GDP-4-dehydro-6-deoxy-D-mannose reductase
VRVWVTGAGGFVGRHLLPRLVQDGHDAVPTDRELDVTQADEVEARVAELAPDAVVHLAAQSSVPASRRDPGLTYRINYLGARSILRAVQRRQPRARILLVGSADAYGSLPPGARPFTEASPLRPRSPYARTKSAAELLGTWFASQGLDVVRIRAFNHFGPGQTDAFVLPSFARQIAEMEAGKRPPVMRVGNLDSVRDFLDVADVIDAYVRLLQPGVPAGVYNVARGEGIRVGDALEQLLSLAKVRPSVEPDPQRMRPADFSVGDASRLRRATGWEPRIPLARTLETLLDWWRQRVSAA